MPRGRYEIIQNADGTYFFKLLTVSGQVLAHSSAYSSLPPLKRGIASLRVNSDAPVEDMTFDTSLGNAEMHCQIKCPKIEIISEEKNGVGGYNFAVRAKNGNVIAVGEGYGTKKRCLEAVSNLKYIAFSADTV